MPGSIRKYWRESRWGLWLPPVAFAPVFMWSYGKWVIRLIRCPGWPLMTVQHGADIKVHRAASAKFSF